MGWQAAEGADRNSRKSDRRGKSVFGCTGNAAGNSGYHASAAHDTDAGSQRACAGSAGYTGGAFLLRSTFRCGKRGILSDLYSADQQAEGNAVYFGQRAGRGTVSVCAQRPSGNLLQQFLFNGRQGAERCAFQSVRAACLYDDRATAAGKATADRSDRDSSSDIDARRAGCLRAGQICV